MYVNPIPISCMCRDSCSFLETKGQKIQTLQHAILIQTEVLIIPNFLASLAEITFKNCETQSSIRC